MKWKNVQFGEFEYEEKHIIEFPAGIIGFEDLKKFIIVDDESSEPFRWLVSLEDSELSFPILALNESVEILKKYFPQENVTLFAVASIKEDFEDSTVNLKSPIVIDNTLRNGRQAVIEDETLHVRTPLTTFSTILAE
jgi:flagellar assembly factor FliW